jgi:hypothetical protein
MTQTWDAYTEDGQRVVGSLSEMKTVVENNTPLKRGWTAEWREYLVVRGQSHGLQYVRKDSKGRYVNESGGHPRYPTGPLIRPVGE